MKEKQDRKISLDRHRRHRKIRPWKNLIRILIFLLLLLGLYYFLTNMIEIAAEKQEESDQNPKEIEVPIDMENMNLDTLSKGPDSLNQ